MEKKLESARKQLVGVSSSYGNPPMILLLHVQSQFEDKEKKFQKELAKGTKDPAATQEKLQEATDAKVQAQVDGKVWSGGWYGREYMSTILSLAFSE